MTQYEEAVEHFTAALRSARHVAEVVGAAGADAIKEVSLRQLYLQHSRAS
jgi:hypothetical protein